MDDWHDCGEDEQPKPRRTARWAWWCLILLLAWLVIDLLGTATLPTDQSQTFQKVGTVR